MIGNYLTYAIERFDIEAYLIDHHGEPTRKANEWAVNCPNCLKDKIAVNTQTKIWHCWVCQHYENVGGGRYEAVEGAGGLLDLIMLLDEVDRKAAAELVLAAAFMRPDDLQALPDVSFLAELEVSRHNEAREIAYPPFWKLIHQQLPYMTQRRITMEDARHFGLFYCDAGRYANRLVFPVWENGRFVYFQARAMWDPPEGTKGFRKALNPPATDGAAVSTDVLMNLDYACRYPRVAIVEGPTDCVMAGPDAVCTFGKTISGTQMGKLHASGVTALDLMWDADAKSEMIRWGSVLSTLFDVRLVFLPHGDPGNYTRQQLNWFRTQSYQNVSGPNLMMV